jgi:hypothetical protein
MSAVRIRSPAFRHRAAGLRIGGMLFLCLAVDTVPCMDGAKREIDASGFDVVIGNPPFINAIEGRVEEASKPLLRHLHQRIGGTADVGYYFLGQSVALSKDNGRIGLVLPRAVLNASPIEDLRRWLLAHKAPVCLHASTRSNFFPGASIFVALVVLGREPMCSISLGDDPTTCTWDRAVIDDPNWWRALYRHVNGLPNHQVGSPANRPTVGAIFDVSASLTASDAYELKHFLKDDAFGTGLKLVTTGLIEPDACMWGDWSCRYLGVRYRCPRVQSVPNLPASLRMRIDRANRPKVLVAGLSSRIESVLDVQGAYLGAVSTFTVLHPEDDIDALRSLQAYLSSEHANVRFQADLGGNALGGGNITMKKSFLQNLPYPGDDVVISRS